MSDFRIDGGAQGATALAKGIGAALQRVALADSHKQDAYLSTLGRVKAAEEARGLKMTNDHRERADEYRADEALPPHHRAAMIAFKLLGADADKFSKAASVEQAAMHRDAVLQDPKLATPVAQAHFATSGKAPFDNVGITGHTLNQVTGEQVMASPAMAKLFQGRAATSGGGALTLSQQRGNAEIDAARDTVSGLTPEEIRRRTAKTTDTGRENPDYDPTVARSATLAGRRKIGADSQFDGRGTQALQPAPQSAPVAARFKADPAMSKYTLGNQTPNGYEVKDSTGKVIGHYR